MLLRSFNFDLINYKKPMKILEHGKRISKMFSVSREGNGLKWKVSLKNRKSNEK